MNKPEFIVLIGLPGCGKSTWCDNNNYNLELKTDNIIISTDNFIESKAIRLGTTYSKIFKDTIDEATKAFMFEIEKYINYNQTIIIDRTNVNKKSRKFLLDKANKMNKFIKKAIYFDVPLDIIKERVIKRGQDTGKIIPEFVIDDMYNRLELPSYDEGFDKIETIKNY